MEDPHRGVILRAGLLDILRMAGLRGDASRALDMATQVRDEVSTRVTLREEGDVAGSVAEAVGEE
ncbi:MAG: hypothetical protein Q8Q13_03330 [bacterium]|nr:hypothetical protein [bacterium]